MGYFLLGVGVLGPLSARSGLSVHVKTRATHCANQISPYPLWGIRGCRSTAQLVNAKQPYLSESVV